MQYTNTINAEDNISKYFIYFGLSCIFPIANKYCDSFSGINVQQMFIPINMSHDEVCSRVQKSAKECQSMPKNAKECQKMLKSAKECKIMQKNAKEC